LAVVFVALAAFVGTCYGLSAGFYANYHMRNSLMYPNGYMNGTVYYWYDSTTLPNSRLRFETAVNMGNVHYHVELYHYQNGALYTICSVCQAAHLAYQPDYYGINEVTDTCEDDSVYPGFKRCTRQLMGGYGVVELVAKGTLGEDGYGIKYVKYSDGRELEFLDYNPIANPEDQKTKFEVDGTGCPEPVCKSKMDVIFVLDASGSVDEREWRDQKNFLQEAVKKFKLDNDNAKVGIVEFCGPTCCDYGGKECPKNDIHGHWFYYIEDAICPQDNITINYGDDKSICQEYECNKYKCLKYEGNWWNKKCVEYSTTECEEYNYYKCARYYQDRRYSEDCDFDGRCTITESTTAKIFMELTYDDVDGKIGKLVNADGSSNRISGNTCQRYGLVKAYDMLYGDGNDRCTDQNNRTAADCPVPVVIVITDGAEFCAASTKEWADKIKAKDSRALLIEVAVGLGEEYDQNYLKSLASVIGGESAVLPVDGYAQVNTILDKMISPVCSLGTTTTGSCGSSCHGYCACSTCLCPTCESEASSVCNYYECLDVDIANGCQEFNVTCSSTDAECFVPYCDKEETENPEAKCKTETVDCAEVLAERGRPLKQCEYTICSHGCSEEYIYKDNEFCKELVAGDLCKIAKCDPENSPDDSGCVILNVSCEDSPLHEGCNVVQCVDGTCTGFDCEPENPCIVDDVLKCPPEECVIVTCDPNAYDDEGKKGRCIRENITCESKNKCRESVCRDNACVEFPIDGGCSSLTKEGGCRSYRCDASAKAEDGTDGACVATLLTHDANSCVDYSCGDDDMWIATPRCTSEKACKISRCDSSLPAGENCIEVDVDCYAEITIPSKCFEAACREPDGCYKKQYRDAYFDVCGNCVGSNEADSAASFSSETLIECTMGSEEELETEGLAAAAIALIVLGAIIIGAAIAISSVVGTKALIDRARNASDQAVVSNPLFEDSQTEMSNPAFLGDA